MDSPSNDDIDMEDMTVPRRSTRTRQLPARYRVNALTEFTDKGGNCNQTLLTILNSDTIAEVEVECDTSDLHPLTQSFIAAETAFAGAALHDPIDDQHEKDPTSIQHAQSSIYWSYWLAAIYEELESLKAKEVYEEVEELPPGRKAVGCKWVLRIKRDREGLISRFKARLVAKGFTQIPGQDYNYTFAPVARWESIRTLLTLAAEHNMELRQIDVKTAYLNGPLEEEIYMHQPSTTGSRYWRLRKGLYGLKQSGRQWYLELNKRLNSVGFKRTESDWSLYIRTEGSERSILTTSVDDMLVGSSGTSESDAVVLALKSLFDITDNGEPTYHLGCGIHRDRQNRTIKLDQGAYTLSILRDFGFENCNPVSTPMASGARLFASEQPLTPEEREKVAQFPYTAVVGKSMYLSTCSRPDIAYTVRELARFMASYGPEHIAAAKHLLRYLKGTIFYGIWLGRKRSLYPLFRALSDSDWGMGDGRKSVSGFLITMNGSPLSWSSKQQSVIALSSCEAEYLATTHCARDVLWFRNLFAELGFAQESPTSIFCDNQGTIACTHDPHAHSKMKHIAIREHFIRDCIVKRLVDVIYVSNKENIADIFTKPLHRVLHAQWVKMLGLDASQGGVLDADPTP
jgi:hypothetical protein